MVLNTRKIAVIYTYMKQLRNKCKNRTIFDAISGIATLATLKAHKRLFVHVVTGENKIKIRMAMQGNPRFRIALEL